MNKRGKAGRKVLGVVSIILTVLIIIGLVFYGSLPESYNYRVGSVAESDIYAPRTFVDNYETERQAVIARGLVPAIFVRSDDIAESNVEKVNAFFDLVDQERSVYTIRNLTEEQAADELSINVKQSLSCEINSADLLVFFNMTHSSFRYIKDKAISMAELIMIEDVDEGTLASAIASQVDSFKVSSPSYSISYKL